MKLRQTAHFTTCRMQPPIDHLKKEKPHHIEDQRRNPGQLFHHLAALVQTKRRPLVQSKANLAGDQQAGDKCKELAQLERFILSVQHEVPEVGLAWSSIVLCVQQKARAAECKKTYNDPFSGLCQQATVVW